MTARCAINGQRVQFNVRACLPLPANAPRAPQHRFSGGIAANDNRQAR